MVPRGSSLVSLDCPPSHDRMGIAPLVAFADGAVDCGSVGSSTATL